MKRAPEFAVEKDDAELSGSNSQLSASLRKLQTNLDKTDIKPKFKERMPEVGGYRILDVI